MTIIIITGVQYFTKAAAHYFTKTSAHYFTTVRLEIIISFASRNPLRPSED